MKHKTSPPFFKLLHSVFLLFFYSPSLSMVGCVILRDTLAPVFVKILLIFLKL